MSMTDCAYGYGNGVSTIFLHCDQLRKHSGASQHHGARCSDDVGWLTRPWQLPCCGSSLWQAPAARQRRPQPPAAAQSTA